MVQAEPQAANDWNWTKLVPNQFGPGPGPGQRCQQNSHFELAFIRVDGKRGEKDKFQGALLLGAIKTYVQSQDDERYTWAQLFSNHCSEVLLHLSDAMCHSNMQHRSLVCSTCWNAASYQQHNWMLSEFFSIASKTRHPWLTWKVHGYKSY